MTGFAMSTSKVLDVLQRVCDTKMPDRADLRFLLSLTDETDRQELFDFADSVRKKHVGDGILLRGIVEFANYCNNGCLYCGLNKDNKGIGRYRLNEQQVYDCISHIYADGMRTVVLQAGEQDDLDPVWLKELIERVKADFEDIAITLSVGECSREDYQLWKTAGADRYLLKIECSDKSVYESMHPEMSFETRVKCLRDLKEIGYQTGSGCIVGLKGQTADTLAGDILFFTEHEIDMIGIGPFIPHQATSLRDEEQGTLEMVLNAIAVTRIVTKDTHLPATTATGSIGEGDGRLKALKAGANVLMPNYTPLEYKKLYEIYPGKRCVTEPAGACAGCMEKMAASLGRHIDYSIGHSFKMSNE
jgi:biotin synthase